MVVGALAGAPTEIELATASQFEEGKQITASAGCLARYKIGENGNTLGPTSPRSATGWGGMRSLARLST